MLIVVDADARLRLRSSKAVRVVITAQGYLTGSAATPGPGGTKALPHYSIVRSDKKLGPAIPASGGAAAVTVAGLGGIPTSGVRAVWLSVQTHSRGASGSLGFAKADGGGTPGSAVAEVRNGWATSLVLAPVTADGRILYKVNGTPPTTLRLIAVGYVGQSTATDEKTVINNALTLGSNRKATPKLRENYTRSGQRQKIYALKVTGTAVPSATSRVVVRATVATGPVAGEFKHQLTQSSVKRAKPIPLPKASVANIVFNQLVGANGLIYVSVPRGASLMNVAVVATVLKAKSLTADPTPPIGTINPISGGAINLALTPEVTITGTAYDAVSGIRSVAVYRGQTFLGSAVVDTTKATPTWSLTTSLAPGTGTVWARIKDFAARTIDTAGQPVTVTAPNVKSAVAAPDAIVLNTATCAQVTAVTDTTVAFSGSIELKPGAVIVCDATAKVPGGFIKRVAALRTVRGKTTVTTQPASVLDALLQGEFEIKDTSLGSTGTGRTLIIPEASTAGVTVGGAEAVSATASLKLAIATGWSDGPLGATALTALEYAVGVKADTQASVKSAAAVTAPASSKASHTIAPTTLTGASVKLGPIPVVFTAELTPSATIEGTAAAGADVTETVEVATSTGAELRDVNASSWTFVHHEQASGTSAVAGPGIGQVQATWQNVVKVGIGGLPGPTVTAKAQVTDTVAAATSTPSASPTDPSASPSTSLSPSSTASPTGSATPTSSPPVTYPGLTSAIAVTVTGSLVTGARLLGIASLTEINAQIPTWNHTIAS
jgi:hypothetical protein